MSHERKREWDKKRGWLGSGSMREEKREVGFGLRKRKFKKKKRGKERGWARRERDVSLILIFFGFVSMLNFVFVI